MDKKLIKIFLFAFIFRLILAFVVWHPDVNNHIDWGIRFWEYGPEKFYSANVWSFTWPNQPPGSIYIFAGIRKLFELIFAIFWWINIKVPPFPSGIITYFESNLYPALLKLPAIFADLGIAYLIYKFLNKHAKKFATFGAVLFLINPVTWYNSSVWGQTDSVVNFLALLAFYFLLQKKLFFAIFSFVLSLYIKASLLIFLPIFVIVIWRQRYKISEIVKTIVFCLVPIALLTLPFSSGEPSSWLYELFKDKIFKQQLHVITANAFNIWAAIVGIHEKPDSLMFGPLTYQTWGYILFSLSFIPALYIVYKKQDIKSLFWALSITAFSAFILLTNMHERYLYPLFPYLTILVAIRSISLYPYILISLISLLNLYHFWWVPKIDFLVSVLSAPDRLAPRIFGLINFFLFIYLYSHFLRLSSAKKI